MNGAISIVRRDGRGSPERPTLDQIASAPASVSTLSREAIAALLIQCAAVQNTLAVQFIMANDGHDHSASAPPITEEDEFLTPAEAAKLLRRKDARWVYRHKNLPFVHRVNGRVLLCSKRGLEKWLAGRRAVRVT
jgi:hypothetical protein